MSPLSEPAIFGGTLLLTMLSMFLVFFVGQYHKKQIQYQRARESLMQQLRVEGLRSQMEMIEEVLVDLTHEIHNNIGQRLTLAGMYLEQIDLENNTLKSDMSALIKLAVNDLRELSKKLRGNYVIDKGIILALENEVNRLAKANSITVTFEVDGDEHTLSEEQEVILFRCAQEVLNHAIKQEQATTVKLKWKSSHTGVMLTLKSKISDNLTVKENHKKNLENGFTRVKRRIALLGGNCKFEKTLHESRVELDVPVMNDKNF